MKLIAVLARFGGLFNQKLQKRNIGLATQRLPTFKGSVWIHCASLGEFEQGKVLIDAVRSRYPNKKMVLTFFSSSGYEKKKNFEKADAVLYLPYDTPGQMQRFVDKLNPKLVIFIKYEFWYSLLDCLKDRDIPFIFVSSVFRPDQYLFRGFYKSLLDRILYARHIFVQNRSSLNLLERFNYHRVTLAGDTRIDRVLELKDEDFYWEALERWVGECKSIVAGSTWPDDEQIIAPCLSSFPEIKWIIAPHELTREHMKGLRKLLGEQAVFMSDLSGMDGPVPDEKQILVIDRIGILSLLYRYGDIAYIGGGLGAGIHNTLEPAVYGLPLMYGPNYEKFQEAVDFHALGAARIVNSTYDMDSALKHFLEDEELSRIKDELDGYFKLHSGATQRIMNTIEQILPES